MANVAQFIDISDGTGRPVWLGGHDAKQRDVCGGATDQLDTGVGYSIKCASAPPAASMSRE